MKDKTITIFLFGILVALVILYFFTLNHYFIKNYPIDSYINTIMIQVNQENWDDAEKEMER